MIGSHWGLSYYVAVVSRREKMVIVDAFRYLSDVVFALLFLKLRRVLVWAVFVCLCLVITPVSAESLKIAATTTTDNSGLLPWLKVSFEQQTGINVRMVVVGSGAAFTLAKKGDVDALLVHDPPREKQFISQGWGVKRRPVFYNHFVLVGPKADPAQVQMVFLTDSPKHFSDAFQRIQQSKSIFLSRGDKSGTHQMEKYLWNVRHLAPWQYVSRWYLETGSSMGSTLNTAAVLNAYTLSDIATWHAFKNKQQLRQFFPPKSGPKNTYSAIIVNPNKHRHLQTSLAGRWLDWLYSPNGKKRINSFRVQGKQVFFAL